MILTGITIKSITTENGIIKSTITAKENSEIANEKECLEEASISAIGKNKTGNLLKDELEEELDKLVGNNKTIVSTDSVSQGYFVKFIDSSRIYKVSLDGNVEYLGKEKELITQAYIKANPESNITPELRQEVELTVETPIEIEVDKYSLVYAWNQSPEIVPADTNFIEAELSGEGRKREATAYSIDTVGGNYYLWVRIVVGEIEKEECFGPYAIKDHTTIIAVSWNESLVDGAFLGNSEVERGNIQNINIIDSLEGHSLEDENTWDISQGKTGKYLAWYEVNENGYYDVTIAGNGGLVANSYSGYLFQNIGANMENQTATITGLENLETGLAKNMESMFCNSKVEALNISSFDTSNVTNMKSMFSNCYTTKLDLSNFNTSNVKTMSYMFQYCKANEIDVSNFDTTKVSSMFMMFIGTAAEYLDLSSFNTSNVTDMWRMFAYCKAKEINISSFDTRNVTVVEGMFRQCPNLEKIEFGPNFTLPKANDVSWLFGMSTKLKEINISNFEIKEGADIQQMFYYCSSLNKLDIRKFDITKATHDYDLLNTVPSTCEITVLNETIKKIFEEGFRTSYTNVAVAE